MMPSDLISSLLAMAAPADPNASPWVSLLPFAFILGIFYFMVLMPMRRRQKKVADFQSSLKVGDRVITTGGIYGTITSVKEDRFIVRVGDNTQKLEIGKGFVHALVKKSDTAS